MKYFLRLLAVLLAVQSSVSATSIQPPQLDELVSQSEWVAVGVVTATRSEWRENHTGRSIYTVITFVLEDMIVGEAAPELELVFLGGEVGDDRVVVVGQPRFAVGDRELLFVANAEARVSPVSRMGYGRFRVLREQAGDHTLRMYREDYSPLADISDIARELGHLPAEPENSRKPHRRVARPNNPAALSLAQFRKIIVQTAYATGRSDVNAKLL